MTPVRWFVCLLVACVPSTLRAAAPAAPASSLSFEQHIRPLFKVHCLHCHGDGDDRKGGLDVRLRRLLVEGGDSGAAIVPGKPEESYLVDRLKSGEMPPGEKKLSAAEIALVEQWVTSGAKTLHPEPQQIAGNDLFTPEEREFWSFQPVRRPSVPALKNAHRIRTPVDAFIVEQLHAAGLALSPDADLRTLIRRAYYDLLGLPPTPAEVEAFLADRAPAAYERLIDRLLARPEYGERWGRHWLDVAGYADSDGYTTEDPVRAYAYKYRDYVIRAFNNDKPFDEFIREQLAGDELVGTPQANLKPDQIEKLVATGFLKMAPDGTGSGAVDANLARNHVMADTIKIVSASLLGLTVGCAECHSHKYDPISHADYYRFRAIFEPALDWKNWRAPRNRLVSLATDADRQRTAEIEAEAAKIDQQRVELQQQFIASTFEEELLKLPENMREPIKAAFTAPGPKRTPEQQKLLRENPSVNVSAGSLYLYDRDRTAAVRSAENRLALRRKNLIAAAFQRQLAATPDGQSTALRDAALTPAAKRSAEQKQLLADYPGALVDADSLARFDPAGAKELAAMAAEVERLQSKVAMPQINKLLDDAIAVRRKKPTEDFVHCLTEIPGKVPTTYVFNRGMYEQPRQAVLPGEPTILCAASVSTPPVFGKGPEDKKLPTTGRRLALARRLTDGTHPLVGRVLVNRIWLHHFGRGIVGTPSDFGMLGERPSHAELLDWLTGDFVAGGWRLKRLHKLLMTSTVYRQASRRTPEQETKDPDNRLLSRMNVLRVEAEVLRDSILAVSGKLNAKRYGRPVPVSPDEVGQIVIAVDTRDSAGRPSTKQVSLGDEVFRRSVYVQVRRSMPLSMLETFDAPTMSSSCNCEVRSTSTVAPQSLTMLNGEFQLEQAGHFADRLRNTTSGTAEQVVLAWKLALARPPEKQELADALDFLKVQATAFAAQRTAAGKPVLPKPGDAELRALTNLCQALLSSNEFLYVD